MKRLINILLFGDLRDEQTRWMEKDLRSLGRVLTIGIGQTDAEPDMQGARGVHVEWLISKLPPALQPDILISIDPSADLFPVLKKGQVTFPVLQVSTRKIQQEDLLALSESFDKTYFLNTGDLEDYRQHLTDVSKSNLLDEVGQSSRMAFEQLLRIHLALDFSKEQTRGRLGDSTDSGTVTKSALHEDGEDWKENISFVIAVLDESPASPHGIETLLEDLGEIGGEVICVFNDADMARKYADHPCINLHAVMSENIGVGRAWNVGMMLSTRDVVYILNSDLQLGEKGVQSIYRTLSEHEKVAVVGPCGGYTSFSEGKDLYYLDKKKISVPTRVDQVGGFYFAVKRRVLAECGISFYPDYIPCYMEEWDLALQLREHGYGAMRVFVEDYKHEWGGTIRGKKSIQCLGKDYETREILPANRSLFMKRWASEFSKPDVLVF